MSGPFTLKYLHLFLRETRPGAFILSRNGRAADLVGASGDDVAAAIRRSAGEKGYRYFWYSYADSAEQAFMLEQAWHHRYHPTDHPSAPASGRRLEWRCTTEGCAACALSPVRR